MIGALSPKVTDVISGSGEMVESSKNGQTSGLSEKQNI